MSGATGEGPTPLGTRPGTGSPRRLLPAVALLALARILAAAPPVSATELWSHGESRLSLSGSLRELGQIGSQTSEHAFANAISEDVLVAGQTRCLVAAEFADCPAFDTVGQKDAWQALTRLRTRLDLQVVDGLEAVVVYDHELTVGILDTFEANLATSFQRDDLLDADWTIVSSDRAEWRHLFYRGYVRLTQGALDLTVGRQRIAWGVGRLWNPIDRFNAIPPLAVEPDQTQGIDSVDARWSFNGFDYAEAVYAPGSGRNQARYALRWHGVVRDTDLSVMGGVFEQAPTAGVDLARNLGDAAIRLEAVYTDPHQKVWKLAASGPRRPDDFVQVVAGIDYTFDVANGIYVLAEHLYNGNALGFGRGRAGSLLPFFEATSTPPPGLPPSVPGPYVTTGSTALFGSSRVVTSAEQQTGFLVGGDITPELRLDFLSIYDWNGHSAAFFPSLKFTPTGSLEVTVGVQTFAGPRRSQYGSAETFVYLLADLFF